MTLNEIKAMFRVADRWTITREGFHETIVRGNTGDTVLHAMNLTETRIIDDARSADLVTIKPDGRKTYAPWPKAKEIIEARPGYLKWRYGTQEGTITLEKQP